MKLSEKKREAHKAWYRRNRDRVLQQAKERYRRIRETLLPQLRAKHRAANPEVRHATFDRLAKARRILGWARIWEGCKLCGYNHCSAAIACHHIDPNTKSFATSQRALHRGELWLEYMKTVCLCFTCHHEVHAALREIAREN